MSVTLTLLVGVIVLYAGLVLIGGWVWLLLRQLAPSVWRPPAALLGIVVAQLVGWYWSAQADRGLFELWPFLFLASAVATALLAWKEREELLRAVPGFRWAPAAIAAVMSTGLSAWMWRGLLARPTLSIAATNNDIAAYAAVTRHISHAGFSAAGPIAGFDLGHLARTDVYGSLNLLSFAHWITGQEVYELALPVMVVSCALLAQALVGLLERTTRLNPRVISLLAVVPQSTFIFTYIVTCYFGSQILGCTMATAAGVMIFSLPRARDRRGRVVNLAGLVTMFVGLTMTYPHMLFLCVPLLVLSVLTRADARQARGWLIATVAAAFAGAAILGPERFWLAVDRTLFLGHVTAGWPLPGVLPAALVGFQSSWSHTVSPATIAGSVVLVVVACAAALRLGRYERATWQLPAVAIIALGLGSYAALYFLRGGPGYNQWKWVSFLQPLLCLALIAPISAMVLIRWPTRRTTAALAFALVVLIAGNTVASDQQRRQVEQSGNWVSQALGEMGRAPELADVESVNIDLGPYWESMWAADALAPRTVYLLKPTYYGITAPKAPWTLVHREDVPAGLASSAVRLLEGGYALVRTEPDTAAREAVQGR